MPMSYAPRDSTESYTRSLASGQDGFQRKHSDASTKIGSCEEEGGHNSTQESKFGSASTAGMTESGTLVGAGDEELGQLLLNVHKKASSQVLRVDDQGYSQISEEIANSQEKSLRAYGSSSTLHSFYDPQRFPLAVSQQTSDSSARDFALRKGCPTVVSVEGTIRPTHARKGEDPNDSKSTKKTSPARFDLSMLFPKPTARHGRPFSSQNRRASPNLGVEQWEATSSVPLGSSSTQQQKSKHVKVSRSFSRTRRDVNPTTTKPKRGPKNWFDNLGELVSEDESDYDEHGRQTHSSNSYQKELSQSNPFSNVSCSQPLPSHPSIQNSPAQEQLRLALQNWEFRSKHHVTVPREKATLKSRKSKGNVFDNVDLNKNSVLCLSSSEDEFEEEESDLEIGHTIPGIRDSLVIGPMDSDVEIGTAHAVKTKRPNLETEASKRKNRNRVSHLSDPSLITMKVLESQQSFLSDETKSQPRTQVVSSANSMVDNTMQERTSTYFDTASTMSQKTESLSRLMTVTAQEESLLEAMRSKASSMRLRIMAEAMRSASVRDSAQSSSSVDAPQRPKVNANDASFLHLSGGSIPTSAAFTTSSSPSGTCDFHTSKESSNRGSGSTDPDMPKLDNLARSSLPSSSGDDTPPTPTDAPTADASSRKTSSTTKRYSSLPTGYQRHSQNRTGSSDVIVLDTLGDSSSGQYQESGYLSWAFNGFSDRASLAAVH